MILVFTIGVNRAGLPAACWRACPFMPPTSTGPVPAVLWAMSVWHVYVLSS